MKINYPNTSYWLSDEKNLFDLNVIAAFLTESYWAKGRPREVIEKSIAHSECFGLFEERKQIGFARVITDYATFAYLADVFVLPTHQNQGLGRWMLDQIFRQFDSYFLRRFMLATRDAHSLYAKFGFTELEDPKRYMVRSANDLSFV